MTGPTFLRYTLFVTLCLTFLATGCKPDEEGEDPTPCTEQTWYQDADNDGLGNPNATTEDCEQPAGYVDNADDTDDTVDNTLTAVERTFGDAIDLDNLENYSSQNIPGYITKDNTNVNAITDAGATLGRVLFYDRALSVDYSTSCADCHQQDFAFTDPDILSQGANGLTGRHSMRLVNARFADDATFFWDERAATLEIQTTMPIQDHAEMGFSGANGDPSLDDLIERMEGTDYYLELFEFVYGTSDITEVRIQSALAQFVRSIQSFDSRYDEGMAQADNIAAPFPNFSPLENQGKLLFTAPPVFDPNSQRTGGGLGCQGCHRAPEFDIAPNSQNNGVITVATEPGSTDLSIIRSPSLRDIFNPNGLLNGPLMHDGAFADIDQVIDHYNDITFNPAINNQLDARLRPAGQGQQLNITAQERAQLIAFLQTLTGDDMYSNPKWSDPFQ